MIKDVIKQHFPKKDFNFTIQNEQKGISHALLCADEYIDTGDTLLFILGDNFFQNDPTTSINMDEVAKQKGAYIFSYKVNNPEEFGVAELDVQNNVVSIEEKPENPKSNNAVVGVYIYDDTVMEKIKTLKPSARGEYEVTDLCNLYIEEGICKNVTLSGWWIDAGTPERIIELESKLT